MPLNKGFCRVGISVFLGVALLFTIACASNGAKDRARNSRANQHFRMALLNYQRGALVQAIEHLEKAIQINSEFDQAYNLLGLVFLDTQRFNDAVRMFRRALVQNPYFTDVHNNLGTAFRKMGKYSAALAEFEKALKNDTYSTPQKVHFNIAQTYLDMGRPEEAIASLKEAVLITPKYGKARLELAKTFRGMGRHSEAKKQLEMVVKLLPETEDARKAQDLLNAKEY